VRQQQEGRPPGGGEDVIASSARAGRRQPHAGQPQIGWVRMLDAHPNCSLVSGPSDELSSHLTEASERVVR
jgi:hypothetical protein